MKKSMQDISSKYKRYWREKSFLRSTAWGLLFFIVTMVFNHFASIYATAHASSSVRDLLLDNLPLVNVDFIINEGAAIFWFGIVILALMEPKRIPFLLKSVALFIFVRSFFIMFTHLGPFPTRSLLEPGDILNYMTSGGDYFFSGHTGLPFLMALVFWNEKRIRIACLCAAVFFGMSVLLGHLHYSIDVFAAFFITHTIFVLARRFFARDFMLFNKHEEALTEVK